MKTRVVSCRVSPEVYANITQHGTASDVAKRVLNEQFGTPSFRNWNNESVDRLINIIDNALKGGKNG